MPCSKSGVEAEVALDLLLDAGDLLGLGQLEDRLGVVGHRAVAIDGDVDRAHAQEAERHQAEGEDRADADERPACMSCTCMTSSRPCRLTKKAPAIRPAISMPFQKALKLPATRPERIVSDAPPSRDAVTISWTCLECELVKTLVNSGISTAASVPQLMIDGQLPPQVRVSRVAADRQVADEQPAHDERGR